MVQPLRKTVCYFPTKLNICLPYNTVITQLGIYPNEFKTYVHTKTCPWMFIAALLKIVKNWKQLRCPSVDEQINQLWYIQTMEYNLALKKKKDLSGH